MKRWLLLGFVIAVALLGAWWFRGGLGQPSAADPAPTAEIDDASKRALENILEQADRERDESR